MTDAIKELTTTLFGECPWLGVLLIAMVPIVELRGAIPFALSGAFWGTGALSWWEAFLVSVVGSTVPALVIVPALKPMFAWMKKTKVFRKLATALEKRFVRKSSGIAESVVDEKKKRKVLLKKFFGVMGFVAVPLPLTGSWTGSAVAAYLDMPFGWGVLAVFIGNVISGAIMTSICMLFPGAEDIIMYCFLGLAVVLVVGSLVWGLIRKKSEVTAEQSAVQSTEEDKKDQLPQE